MNDTCWKWQGRNNNEIWDQFLIFFLIIINFKKGNKKIQAIFYVFLKSQNGVAWWSMRMQFSLSEMRKAFNQSKFYFRFGSIPLFEYLSECVSNTHNISIAWNIHGPLGVRQEYRIQPLHLSWQRMPIASFEFFMKHIKMISYTFAKFANWKNRSKHPNDHIQYTQDFNQFRFVAHLFKEEVKETSLNQRKWFDYYFNSNHLKLQG